MADDENLSQRTNGVRLPPLDDNGGQDNLAFSNEHATETDDIKDSNKEDDQPGQGDNITNGTASAVNVSVDKEKGTVEEMETDLQDERQAARDAEPLKICKWIVARPRTWFGKIND